MEVPSAHLTAGEMWAIISSCVLLQLMLQLGSAKSLELPAAFQRCDLNNTVQLNVCLDSAILTALRVLKPGIPSLNLDPIDPLHHNKDVSISNGGGSSVRLSLKMQDIISSGLGDSSVVAHSSKLDLEKFTLQFDTITPVFLNEFTHEIEGKVLLLPIRGKGPGKTIANDILTKHTIRFSPVLRDGRSYWHVDDYSISFVPKTLEVYFEGLFPENKKLGAEMRKFLSENSFLLYEELADYVNKGFGHTFKEVANNVFDKLPIDEMFVMKA